MENWKKITDLDQKIILEREKKILYHGKDRDLIILLIFASWFHIDFVQTENQFFWGHNFFPPWF